MATVTAFIRVSKKKVEKAHVRFRLRDGRDLQLFHKSKFEINPDHWDKSKQEIKAKILYDTKKRAEFNQNVASRKKLILDIYNKYPDKKNITSDILEIEIDKELHPEQYGLIEKPEKFFETFLDFIAAKKMAESRKRAFMVIYRSLQRYEVYKRITGTKGFTLSLNDLTAVTLRDFERFLIEEHTYFEKYPKIYEAIPEVHKTRKTPKPEKRGQNTLNGIFVKFRTFILWAIDNGKTTNNPFRAFKIEDSVYGTPFYITIEERNKIFNTDLSENPTLATQRDIFVFQCLVGCRVGDLMKFTRDNVINGAIEYIARKTTHGNPVTVRVPLNSIAKQILDRYKDFKGPGLFPFIAEQRYNDYIKVMFEKAEITRIVTVLNPTTRQAEQLPISKVASSHLARRCFVGNLYKQVKDPNLVGALSGHKEGSKAFARYREIDEQMKTDLVKMLE
jgi:site-specific recombinase XerD